MYTKNVTFSFLVFVDVCYFANQEQLLLTNSYLEHLLSLITKLDVTEF